MHVAMQALLIALLVQGSVPTLPKPGQPIAAADANMWDFRTVVFGLMQRVQADPDYALIEHDGEFRATAYFKGDARAKLATYTRDPRIRAVSVPLSGRELAAISEPFIRWVRKNGFEWTWADADPRQSLVRIATKQPYLVEKMARDAGFDLTRIRIVDGRPGPYVPERG